MLDSVCKTLIISMAYVASSMRSASDFWLPKARKANKINKKAARKGSFFRCTPVVQNGKRTKSELAIMKI